MSVIENLKGIKMEQVDAGYCNIVIDNKKYFFVNPKVYQLNGSDGYIIEGPVVADTFNLDEMKQKLREQGIDPDKLIDEHKKKAGEEEQPAVEEIKEETHDENYETDIKIIMDQVKITREDAIKAYEENERDVVKTIVSLEK